MRYLVFGASGDLGASVARYLAKQGHDLVLHGFRSRDKLESLAVETGGSQTLSFDVRHEASVKAGVKGLGAIDGMAYCSAINPTAAKVADMPLDIWRDVIDVNVTGAFLALRESLPLLRNSQSPAVVLVSSIFGLETPARRSAYGASKHALHGLVQACVREEGAWLRVNAVCPGPMWSENLRQILEKHAAAAGLTLEDYVLQRVGDIPAGRFMELRECAEVIGFLLSSSSSFVSGETVRISGGAIQ